MNFVYSRSTIAMDSAHDRMRLKDKIIANVAKAVKSIQELDVLAGRQTVKLGNYDWQCQRLCEHLDHTLLHGLRHVTPGYWKIVTEFTHKECVKQIKRMRHVTTDLGRGRAWLLMALNESLLESYLRCYQGNNSLVESFYVRDALVRDQDKFEVLLTVIAGLEKTEFQLECDVPYLDLCIYPPKSSRNNIEASMDFDRLSICSMESVHVPNKPLPQTVFETGSSSYYKPDKDSTSQSSDDLSTSQRVSPSLDSGIHSDWNYRQRSITPIDSMNNSRTSQDLDGEEDSLEVIHLSKKGKAHKRKRKKTFNSVSGFSEIDIAEGEVPASAIHGPVIAIPPIDDFKLASAIMNNQNNNDENNVKDLESDDKNCERIGERLPGDGNELSSSHQPHANGQFTLGGSSDDSKKDKNASMLHSLEAPKITTTSSSNMHNNIRDHSSFGHQSLSHGLEISSQGGNRSRSSSSLGIHHEMDHSGRKRSESVKSDKTMETEKFNQDEQTVTKSFTDQIKSKVQNIIDSGEEMEHKENSVKSNISEIERKDSDLFQYSTEEFRDYKGVYEGGTCDELSDQKVPNGDVLKEKPVGPSIYSSVIGSDENESDEDDLTVAGSKMAGNNASNQLINGKSVSNSPVIKFEIFNSHSTPSVLNTGKDRFSSRGVASLHPLDSNPVNRKTPDPLSADQNRSKSVMSYQSISDLADITLKVTNQKADNRPASAVSSNGSGGFKPSQSPYAMSEEDRSSQASQSSSTDLEASGQQQVLQAKVEELIEKRKLNQYTHLTFEEEDGDIEEEGKVKVTSLTRPRSTNLSPGEVELDNNTMLYLMLDIVDSEEEETIVKMFTCCQGHTEGKVRPVYALVTSRSLYLLERQQGKKKFSKTAAITFSDIDFVSIGCQNQILNIACKNKRTKHWLTIGEERTTIALVDCLASSMEKSEMKPGRLVVDTGNTIQKIALQKYIAAECKCEMVDSEVVCYSLVHWEDPKCDKGSCEWDREGMLFYKSQETVNILRTQTWRSGHAVLKDGMLCLYNQKDDNKPAHFLSLGGGQCVGCKRDFNSDRNHAVRIILQNGAYWYIAVETELEANNWLQCLCQAVSEGLKMSSTKTSCVPCCAVISKYQLLMCHEDLETNFMRTLGSANLHDVTSMLSDNEDTSYIVLVFEAEGGSPEHWALYFNTAHECSRFKTALSMCWFTHFQVDVPELMMDDFKLQKQCADMAAHLKQARYVS
ncbi:pleckstrin homology domain-containing family M member 2-like [Dreissena polymorpha]|nr:pleckstrin homology domain-containing family M member 2-like [Dreissena polymorpha]